MLVKKQLFLLCSIQLKLVKTAQVFALILATNSTKIRVTTIIIVILAQPTHRNGGCIPEIAAFTSVDPVTAKLTPLLFIPDDMFSSPDASAYYTQKLFRKGCMHVL